MLQLMAGESDRRAGFVACLCYVDAAGEVHVFEEPDPYLAGSGELAACPSDRCHRLLSVTSILGAGQFKHCALSWVLDNKFTKSENAQR